MRPLEIALVVLDACLLAWCVWTPPTPTGRRIVPAAATVMFLGLGVVLEGARWHMGPAYVLTLWLFVACIWPRLALTPGWTGAAGVGLLVAAVSLATALPAFDLPEPTGSYPIGSVTLHLQDPRRQETLR